MENSPFLSGLHKGRPITRQPLVDHLNVDEIHLVSEGAAQAVSFGEEIIRSGFSVEDGSSEAGHLNACPGVLHFEQRIFGHVRESFFFLCRWRPVAKQLLSYVHCLIVE